MAVTSGQFCLGFCFCNALIYLGSAAASGLDGAMLECSYAAERCVRHWDPVDCRTRSLTVRTLAVTSVTGLSCPCLHRFHECALSAVQVYLGKDAGKNYSLRLERVLVSIGCTKDWTWYTVIAISMSVFQSWGFVVFFIANSLEKLREIIPEQALSASGTYKLFRTSPLNNVDYLNKYCSDFFKTFDDFEIRAVPSSFEDVFRRFWSQLNGDTEDESDETEYERFPVSRLVLALASPRLRRKLRPGEAMAERGYLLLRYPPRVIRALLTFLYTGETTFHKSDFFMLCFLREEYKICGLGILDTLDCARMDADFATSDIHISSEKCPLRNWAILAELAQTCELADFRIRLGSDKAPQPNTRAGQGELAESAAAMGRELRSIMRNDEIRCHRLMLALVSPDYFHPLFRSGMKETKQGGHVEFSWASETAIKRCIRFIYTGKLDVWLSPGDGEAGLAELKECEEVADYWGVRALSEACATLRGQLNRAPPQDG